MDDMVCLLPPASPARACIAVMQAHRMPRCSSFWPAADVVAEVADVELDADDASSTSTSSSGLTDQDESEPEDEEVLVSQPAPIDQKWRLATGGMTGAHLICAAAAISKPPSWLCAAT